MLLGQVFEKHLAEIGEVAQFLWDKGWAEASAGNYSIHLGEINLDDNYLFNKGFKTDLNSSYPSLANHCFLVSTSGSRMREVAHNPGNYTALLHISSSGKQALLYKHKDCSFDPKPTSELDVHLQLHADLVDKNESARCILHAHVTELIALTQFEDMKSEVKINECLSAIHPEYNLFIPEGLAFIPYMESGTLEIAKKTLDLYKSKRVIIWEKHGMLAIEKDLTSAFDLLDLVAKQAGIYLDYIK